MFGISIKLWTLCMIFTGYYRNYYICRYNDDNSIQPIPKYWLVRLLRRILCYEVRLGLKGLKYPTLYHIHSCRSIPGTLQINRCNRYFIVTVKN